MDPVTIGAVLLAIVSGAGSQLGTQLWEGLVSLLRRPFHYKTGTDGDAAEAAVMSAGEAELAAFQQTPGNQHKAVELAEVLLARSSADNEFRRALESWWQQAKPIRMSLGIVTNTISGGTQHGAVLQARDITGITFGETTGTPPIRQP